MNEEHRCFTHERVPGHFSALRNTRRAENNLADERTAHRMMQRKAHDVSGRIFATERAIQLLTLGERNKRDRYLKSVESGRTMHRCRTCKLDAASGGER